MAKGWFDRWRNRKEQKEIVEILRLLRAVRQEQLMQNVHLSSILAELEEIKKKIAELP